MIISSLILFSIIFIFILMMTEIMGGHFLLSNLISNFKYMNWDLFKLLIRYPFIPIYNHHENNDLCTFHFDSKSLKPVSIMMSKKIVGSERVTALAHELGHYRAISIKKISHQKFYPNANSKKVHVNGQIKDEKVAWKEAILIAKDLNIKLNKKVAIKWLKTYNTESAFLNKLEE